MKHFVILLVISMILVTNTKTTFVTTTPEKLGEAERQQMIPDEAIRLRILANSDDAVDQEIKYAVRDRVNAHIEKTVAHIDDLDVARETIEATIPRLNEIVSETLGDYKQQYPFQITFKKDVPFPLKTYGPYLYPAGDYEAILITIGEGNGKNWWCVLFPPLCFIDFFNDTSLVDAEEDEANDDTLAKDQASDHQEDDVEVRFFLFDLFNFS